MDDGKIEINQGLENGMKDAERIIDGDSIVAIILRNNVRVNGVKFFTPSEFSQQLGLLAHKKGKTVKPHKHKQIKRDIIQTQEVLVLINGKVKIDLYNTHFHKIETVHLYPGDTILLASGGHGIEILEDSKMIEIKQGPYAGSDDKEYMDNPYDSCK